MKGRLGKLFPILATLLTLAACSPAAAPGQGGKTGTHRLAHTAKKAGQEGRHQVDMTAKGITRDVKHIPGKAMHGAGQLGREGGHTLRRWRESAAARGRRRGLLIAGGPLVGGRPPLKVIGFVTTDNTKGPMGSPGLDYLAKTPQAVTYLAPLFYSVNADGSLTSHVTTGVEAFAKKYHIKLMPLVNNAGGNHAFLDNAQARHRAIRNIVAAVKNRGFDGVSIDFQLLPGSARVPLNTFMDELFGRLHPLHKVITVNIIPTEAQTGEHGAYDEHTLARYSDQLVLMTYDRHDNSSAPGPVSPHDWVVAAVEHAIHEGVAPNKIYLGVNTYGYDWNTTTGAAMTVPLRSAKTNPHVRWDAAVKEAHSTYRSRSGLHVTWFGNDRSLRDKIAIARRFHLYGLAIWKVGYEDRTFWKTLIADNGNAQLGTAAAQRRVRPPWPGRPASPPRTPMVPLTRSRTVPANMLPRHHQAPRPLGQPPAKPAPRP